MQGSSGFDDEALASVDAIVAAAVEQGQVPGVVAAVARGKAVHVAVAGVMAIGGAPMQRDTVFRITSMTKPMTAAAVLSFVDDGLLKLDEPVDRWLPELADRKVLRRPDGPLDDVVLAQRPITVRDLLTFTWGFGMQGAMFMATEPWPIFTATVDRELATFGPPQPATVPDPDTWMARLDNGRARRRSRTAAPDWSPPSTTLSRSDACCSAAVARSSHRRPLPK